MGCSTRCERVFLRPQNDTGGRVAEFLKAVELLPGFLRIIEESRGCVRWRPV